MDSVYRSQRHIYDVTRKYFLLGRDRLIEELAPEPGQTVLEVGCGTGRNLIVAARRWPEARFFGFDISAAMLETARANVARAGLADRITLAQGDATGFDAQALFGAAAVDRAFISYSVSMIPDWRAAIRAAYGALAPGGRLLIVDFGQQAGLPRWFRALLTRWLALFHVAPRPDLKDAAEATGGVVSFTPLFRDYAWLCVISRP
ncbi:MAG: class I SAM-dependent methyltransferase [Rhodobacteraceae bacterium]|nr:MAG: class I SAM-dependent methyltransferase [Paracoccaceae bacterium]